MNLGVCGLLGVVCALLAMVGWPFALRFVPAIPVVAPMTIAIIALVILVVLAAILVWKKEKVAAKVLFFIFIPLLAGVAYHYSGIAALFWGATWWHAALAAGVPLLLIVVGMLILNAMDISRHGFTFWVTVLFFVGIAIGLYFLLRQWVGDTVASLFTTAAWIGIAFTNTMQDFFPGD